MRIRYVSIALGASLLGLGACQADPVVYEDYQWVGGRGGTYQDFDRHRGKCVKWAETRNLTRKQKPRREDIDECLDQHNWVRKQAE
jgi:hypothetical protein